MGAKTEVTVKEKTLGVRSTKRVVFLLTNTSIVESIVINHLKVSNLCSFYSQETHTSRGQFVFHF